MGQEKTEERSYEDWVAVMDALLQGHPEDKEIAFLKLNRLISGFLTKFRAWDHREEWDDLRQTVLEKLVKSFCRRQLHESQAFVAFAQTITRHEFYDFLKAQAGTEVTEAPEVTEEKETDDATMLSVRTAIRNLPENLRKVVQAIYIEGQTYEEAAATTAIPLGSLKRYLRLGLAQLREQLAGIVEPG
ncbi:MAG: RNA polymerase sigma factor [Candidatus Binatia bacterium]